MKKKILFIMRDFQGGGAERVTIDYLTHLDKEKFEPIVFVLRKRGSLLSELPNDINVVFASEDGKRGRFEIFKILRLLFKEAKDVNVIVGTLELTTTYLATLVGKLLGKPSVGWVHTILKYFPPANSKAHKLLSGIFYPLLNSVVCVSNGIEEDIVSRYPNLKGKTLILYNPIPIEEIVKKGSQHIDIIDSPIILGVGRLVPEKNFGLLISAHEILVRKGIKNNLIILGEGEERERLENLIKELNLTNSVSLLGFQKNPYKYIKNADIFALSSNLEGFAIVIAEALALGTPVVSTDCPSGPGEILKGGEFGKLVPPGNPVALAKALEELLLDPEKVNQYVNKGLNRALDFAPNKIVPDLEKLLYQLDQSYK